MKPEFTVPSILGAVLGGFVYGYNPTLPWILLATAMVVNTVVCVGFLPSEEERR